MSNDARLEKKRKAKNSVRCSAFAAAHAPTEAGSSNRLGARVVVVVCVGLVVVVVVVLFDDVVVVVVARASQSHTPSPASGRTSGGRWSFGC